RRTALAYPLRFGFRNVLPQRQDVDHFYVQTLRSDTVLFVVLLLLLATSLGFANRLRHRRRDLNAIQKR
ncbi:hypothetical protein AIZ09_23220, partial [Salmonella enterica subsp. enterica serovar Typhimurium]